MLLKLVKGKTYILQIGWEATIIGTVQKITANKVHLKNVKIDRGLGKAVYYKFFSLDKSLITNIRKV